MVRKNRAVDHVNFEELKQHLGKSRAATEFGFELTASKQGHAVVRLKVEDRHRQIHGIVHGGILAALADTASGMATYMSCPRGTRVATIELKINFLEAVDGGNVLASARVVRIGKHIAVVDCDLRENRRLVAKSLATFFVGVPKKNRNKPRR